jgi:multiple sugar transport system substrate-binding protein
MKARKPFALALAALTALALTACGTDTPPTEAEGGPATITVAAPDAAWHAALAEAFHEQYPDYTVEFVALNDPTEALSQADVVTVTDLDLLAEWIDDKRVLDVTDVAQYVNSEAVMAYVVNSTTAYGVPYELNEWLLFYNADLFEEAETELPTGAWLWTDFVTAAGELQAGLPTGTYAVLTPDAQGVAGVAFAQAGDASLLNGVDYSFFTPAYERWLGLIESGAATDPADAAGGTYQAQAQSQFLDEDVAMVFAPASLIPALASQADFTWGIVPLPQRDKLTAGVGKVPITVGDPVGYVISADVEPTHLDGAKDWLQFISGADASLLLAAEGVVPAVAGDGVTNAFWELAGLPTDSTSRFGFQEHVTTTLTPLSTDSTAVWEAIAAAHADILSGTAEEVVDKVTALTTEIHDIVS